MIIRAGVKRNKGSFLGIGILLLLAALSLTAVLMTVLAGNSYIRDEMERAGFGDLTAWASDVPDIEFLMESIREQEGVESAEAQRLIFSEYEANGVESDSQGQVIPWTLSGSRYRFFQNNLSGYREAPEEIGGQEVYVSPSMKSMMDLEPGDTVTFPIARGGRTISLTVAGYYEDPFMGSSMIGMKGFLICETDRKAILSVLQNSGIDALARDGAMLHVFSSGKDMTVSELNGIINEHTELAKYTEFVHSRDAIAGFMVILQNAFSGLILAFVLVLVFVVMVVPGHSISSTVETDYRNMGILKTVGLTSFKLRYIQLLQFLLGILAGMVCGIPSAFLLSRLVSRMTLTTTGVLMPVKLPFGWLLLSFMALLFLFGGFIIVKAGKISHITPMKAIGREAEKTEPHFSKRIPAFGGGIYFRLAFRQLDTGKRRYAGAFIVTLLLVFFASLVGRMDAWLGADGKGMMDAFNPADHDIGVQVFGNL